MISLGGRVLRYDFGEFLIEEFDGHSLWPGGDPVWRDNETLVIYVGRRNNPDYGLEQPFC